MRHKAITVTAAAGREVPMHHSAAKMPGGGLVTVVAKGHPKAGREGYVDEIEVETSNSYVRRRMRSGDLVEVVTAPVVPATTRKEPIK